MSLPRRGRRLDGHGHEVLLNRIVLRKAVVSFGQPSHAKATPFPKGFELAPQLEHRRGILRSFESLVIGPLQDLQNELGILLATHSNRWPWRDQGLGPHDRLRFS